MCRSICNNLSDYYSVYVTDVVVKIIFMPIFIDVKGFVAKISYEDSLIPK